MSIREQLGGLLLYRPKAGDIITLLAEEDTRQDGLAHLIVLAETLGLSGDLWRNFLAWTLVTAENPYSLACEGRGDPGGSLSALAERDMARYLALRADGPRDAFLQRYVTAAETPAGRLVQEASGALSRANDPHRAREALSEFYRKHGAGRFALSNAFRVGEHGTLVPIRRMRSAHLSDLVGYELQKRRLTDNTRAFLAGRESNNVLLYGDAGTGKSTCVRALLSEYPDSALRMIELQKTRFRELPELLAALRERNYRFILFIDDLSFEEHETEYKHLKAAIEGGLETMPENVRIYATSNRRHIIRETWNDRADMEHSGDIHRSDTIEEKLSLSSRFGETINFSAPDRRLYHEIVRTLAAQQLERSIDDETLILGANAWEIRHGGVSGRTAQQYIDHLAGKETE